jgi:putative transcriptional regulator
MMMKNNIFEMMVKRGFRTRRAVAEKVGMTEYNFGRLVNGDTKSIKFETMEDLCKLLDCQPGDLFEYVADGEPA